MPPKGGPRSTNRKNVPVSPPKRAAVASLPQAAPRRSARGQSQDADAHDTTTVQNATRASRNALQAVDPSLLPTVNELVDPDVADYDVDPLPSSSPMSDGAQTTVTQMNRLNANRDDMIEALPELAQDANALLSLVAGTDFNAIASLHHDLVSKGLSVSAAGKRVNGRYENLMGNFELSREPFESSDRSFINVRNVIVILANVQSADELEAGQWRADPVLHLANIAQVVGSAMRLDPEDDEAGDEAGAFLAHLNDVFPTPFVNDVNRLSTETIDLGLEIRTQRCIRMLRHAQYEANFDPDITTRNIWIGDDGRELPFDIKDNNAEVPKKWRGAFTARINRIRAHFSTGNAGANNGINFDTLEEEFSWPAFLGRLAVWADHRTKEVNKLIEAAGGPHIMQRLLRGEIIPVKAKKKRQSAAATLGETSAEIEDEIQKLETEKEAKRGAQMLANAAKDAEVALGEFPQPFNEIQEFSNRAESLIPDTGNDLAFGPPVPTQETNMIWETVSMNNRQANKENVDAARRGKAPFIAHQAGAQRVNFEDEGEEDAPGRSRKRQEVGTAEDEDAFEDDSRPQRAKRARNDFHQTGYRDINAVDEITESDPDAPHNAYQLPPDVSSQPIPDRAILTPRRQRAPPTSSDPNPGRHTMSPLRGAPGLPHNGGPQIRIPFTPDETARLVELIEQYGNGKSGISWALLEKKDREHPRGALLQRRGQVGLKDKARNMKMEFLRQRGDIGLPVNFHLIPLGNRLIDQLDRSGVSHRER